jgi:hypothetical protein
MYYWVYESTTRGVQSVGIIETPTNAKPAWNNSESTLDSLHGPYRTLAQASTESDALGGKETNPASSASQPGYSGTPVSNSQGQEVGVVNPQTGQYTSTGNSDTNPGVSIPGLAQIGAFFSDLTNRNTYLRLGKIIVGFALIVIGIAHLVHAGSVISGAAKAVPL